MYRREGDKWITKVDIAWNPKWIGTEQERFFRIDGKRLQVFSMWLISPNWPEKGMGRRVQAWEGVK
ncbi:MAG: lipocalin-like domain-containing protein [Desulfobaccales bacterium]